MSQAGILNEGGGGGSPINTINGDFGSITGSTVTIHANNATLNSGSSVEFTNSGTTSTLNVTDSNNNTLIGLDCGNLSITGTTNNGYGYKCLSELSSGNENNCYGCQAGEFLTSGTGNVAIGHAALWNATTQTDNVAIGVIALQDAGIGTNNTAVGYGALGSKAGGYNVALGNGAGFSYGTGDENSNILISNLGVNGESNVMRLGTTGSGTQQVNATYIAAISGTNVGAASQVVVNSLGKLGVTQNSSFFAYKSASSTNVTGDSTVYTIIFDTAVSNIGSGYNHTTGVFTAPNTGLYQFNAAVYATTVASANLQLGFAGSVYSSDFFVNNVTSSIGGSVATSGSLVIPMTAGDTLSVFIANYGATKTTGVLGAATSAYTSFSGFQIYGN